MSTAKHDYEFFGGKRNEIVRRPLKCCGGWSIHSPLRSISLTVVSNKYFEFFILLCILVNCIVMAMETPGIEEDASHK